MHVSVLDNPDDSVIVTVRGDLDADSAVVLGTALDRVFDRPAPRIVVDLSGVELCDSAGLSAFVTGHDRAAAGGGFLRLAGPGDRLRRLLDTAGLGARPGVYPGVAEAFADHRPD